mgnify:CR=1 FL=1
MVPFLLDLTPGGLTACFLLTLLPRALTPCAQHGHAHLPIFNSKSLNFAYDILLAQTTGLTTPEWELQHNRGHHRNYQVPRQDVASVFEPRSGRLMSRAEYALKGSLGNWGTCYRVARKERKPQRSKILRRLGMHIAIQLGITAALLAADPVSAVVLFMIPNFLARALVWWGSYWHHLGVPRTDVYDSSVTFADPLYNFFSFNSGHHSAHHEKPTLHWS